MSGDTRAAWVAVLDALERDVAAVEAMLSAPHDIDERERVEPWQPPAGLGPLPRTWCPAPSGCWPAKPPSRDSSPGTWRPTGNSPPWWRGWRRARCAAAPNTSTAPSEYHRPRERPPAGAQKPALTSEARSNKTAHKSSQHPAGTADTAMRARNAHPPPRNGGSSQFEGSFRVRRRDQRRRDAAWRWTGWHARQRRSPTTSPTSTPPATAPRRSGSRKPAEPRRRRSRPDRCAPTSQAPWSRPG